MRYSGADVICIGGGGGGVQMGLESRCGPVRRTTQHAQMRVDRI